MQYILAHDMGTSADKATLFTTQGKLIKTIGMSYATEYSHGSWAEQDANDWWKAFCTTTKELLEGIDPKDVVCVAFDGTYPDCILVDENLSPLRKAIIWQDSRGFQQARDISPRLPEIYTQYWKNNIISTDRTLIQLLWVKENEPEVFAKIHKVLVCCMDYVVLKLTGEAMTEMDLGRATAMLNPERTDWAQELLDIAGIPRAILPALKNRAEVVGEVGAQIGAECGLAAGTKIVMGTGDTACTNIGAGLLKPGDAYMNGGTSAGIVVMGADKKPIQRLTASSGSSLSWLKNTILLHEQDVAERTGRNFYDILNEEIAKAPVGSNGVLFHPYLAGERAPRQNPRAKGSFVGISLTTTRQDIMRSVVEGVGFNLNVILQSFRDEGYAINRMPIVGGLANGEMTRQIFADIMNVELITYDYMDEAAAVGVAVLGGMALGIYKDETDVSKFMEVTSVTKPNAANHAQYKKLVPLFEQVYEAQVPVYENM